MFEGFTGLRRECNGVAIHAVVGGEGPPVLLLHGFPQNHCLWAKVAPILAQRYTVVCADLRGYGDSGKPAPTQDLSNYSFRTLAADQLDLMHQLGFDRFHVVGHDRGARTAHRMALDHADALRSIALLDIVPTHDMFSRVDRHLARAYWHWYFLQQPAPYPEEVIAANPDHFYEGCLVGWGATGLAAFDPEQLESYRKGWRQRDAIDGSCADYRATAQVDFVLDEQDLHRRVERVPALVAWGRDGLMGRLFDMEALWATRFVNLSSLSLAGGHFFVDQYPTETAAMLLAFIDRQQAD
jgi:haloacetate dehalogenase